jgi:ketosteroid isomerase-like protein
VVAPHWHTGELAAHHSPGEADTRAERVLVDGADAVVPGEIRPTAATTGRPYRARFTLHLTVEDGPVVRHHVYEDSLAVARVFGA